MIDEIMLLAMPQLCSGVPLAGTLGAPHRGALSLGWRVARSPHTYTHAIGTVPARAPTHFAHPDPCASGLTGMISLTRSS